MSVLSIVVMLLFVVPQFETLFNDMGDALPVLTRVVITGADFIQNWFWLLLVLGLARILRTKRIMAMTSTNNMPRS